jgi:acetyl esterase/lipase
VAQSHKLRPARQIAYGDHPDQVGNLHLPAAGDGPWPVVVLIHGGFWRSGWDRTLMTPLAHDLAARGLAAWNIEYRRVGQEGGGWTGTLDDAAAALAHVGVLEEVDTGRVVTAGHSAGGHLALWLGAGERRVRLLGAVSLAGVADLVSGAIAGLGNGACRDLLGGMPDEVPERYAAASPAALLPLGAPQLLVHGERDEVVPPSQSRDYAEAARAAGDEAELVELADADHFDVIDARHLAWATAVKWIERRFSSSGG